MATYRTRIILTAVILAAASALARSQGTPTAAAPATGQGAQAKPGAPANTQPPVTALTDTGWPRVVTSGATAITIYQPQVESWNNLKLTGRAAVSVKEGAGGEPIYGIVEFSALTEVDKDRRLATLEKLTVTKAQFPNAAKGQRWSSLIEAQATKVKAISLDRLEASLAVTTAEKKGEWVALRNDPPAIIVSNAPAMLILIDGEPQYRAVAGTSLMRVLNSRPLLLRNAAGEHYLKIFDGWMQARAIAGPWTVAENVPPDCDKALKAAIDAKTADLLVGGNPEDASSRPSLKKAPPKIYVETRPTELIVTDGPPKYEAIEGTSLMFTSNTTGNVFIDSKEQRAFVLISGRWFSGPPSMAGPWIFVPADRLPGDFARIPDTSTKENVKASIPGTPQAAEAVVANSIPQTAKVKRSAATFTPTIDGAPRIEPIVGTDLKYVANTLQPVIVDGAGDYFGLQNGVWFVAKSIAGPWLVATMIPATIYAIPPSSPLHYVTYVHIYDSTPEYVVAGYTPGYYGTYISNGVVVYGTGYVYTPWIGTYWYGPPVTYGFGVAMAFTPWAGWHVGFGFGWGWGPTTVAVGWGYGPYPWWGPAAYTWGFAYPWVYSPVYGAAWGPRGAAVWGPGYGAWSTGNVYSHWGATTAVTRSGGGYDAWTGNRWAGQSGMAYNSRTGTLAAGQRAAVGNVYTGNYAAGSRNAAVNARTGVTATGGKVTAGNAYTGREVTAGRETFTGPGGNSATIGGISGNEGAIVNGPNNTYAGDDGNVYRRQDGGGWEKHTSNGWEASSATGTLDRDRAARSVGQSRWDGYRSGSFRSAGGGGRAGGMRGGGRRR